MDFGLIIFVRFDFGFISSVYLVRVGCVWVVDHLYLKDNNINIIIILYL